MPENVIAQRLDAIAATGTGNLAKRDDPLAEALYYLRMDGMFYCQSELSAPWGIDLPPLPDCLWFHIVTKGECLLTDSSGDTTHLKAGDVAVLPHGAGHSAVDRPGAATPAVFDLPHEYVSRQYAVLRHGGGGEEATIICGVVQLGHPAARRLLQMLPEVVHIDAESHRSDWQWLPTLLAMVGDETQSTRPGGETVVTRICDVLVIQAIRSWIDTDPAAHGGWLGALRDPSIGRAISLMHARPDHDWTVTELAAEVGLSRSGFSARFSEFVGIAPKQYLTEWRMQLAQDMLRREDASILAIATRLGYGSEAAFSRAFKRETGLAPSRARGRTDDELALEQHTSFAI